MTVTATPKPRPNYSRPTKYPARLSTMLTASQRKAIDDLVDGRDTTLGDVARSLLADGLVLDAALAEPGLRADVERLARDGGVAVADAIATMLTFAVRESARRMERDGRIARQMAESFARDGVPFDGIGVGDVTISVD